MFFFLRESVRYLGHIVSKDGTEADPDKTTKVKQWPVPKTVKEVQQFLGFANYYRRFIKGFAEIANHFICSQNVSPLHSSGPSNVSCH